MTVVSPEEEMATLTLQQKKNLLSETGDAEQTSRTGYADRSDGQGYRKSLPTTIRWAPGTRRWTQEVSVKMLEGDSRPRATQFCLLAAADPNFLKPYRRDRQRARG